MKSNPSPCWEVTAMSSRQICPFRSANFVFPACGAAGIERKHPDLARIDSSRPIKSWRSAWRGAPKRAGLQLRFHDLRHTCITKLAESQEASEQTLMAIAGHVSRRMIEHYSHIRIEVKRGVTDAVVEGSVNQNVYQPSQTQKRHTSNVLN